MTEHQLAKDLLEFINTSKTMFHAAANVKSQLLKSGFEQLDETASWTLEPGKSYFVERNSSAIAAFTIGTADLVKTGFHIVGAHTDSPGLKIKNDTLNHKNGCTTLSTEVYGGPIISTWLDRSLSIAGKVIINNKNSISETLISFDKPIATIPNLAIHLNREVNKGFEYNEQKHLSAIIDIPTTNSTASFFDILAEHLMISKDQIIDADLFLADAQPGHFTGLNEQLISSPKIDNLAMCHSILTALTTTTIAEQSAMGIFYDNEEVGSQTRQGAGSSFIKDLLERIVLCSGGAKEDVFRTIASSFQISADGAHALHPNFADKHDPNYAPQINKGPVIKLNANYRYATTATSAGRFIQLCEKSGIPYQKMANRSDMPSGSTIGPISSTVTGIETVDVGNPMLAMHAIREVAGVTDHHMMTKVLTTFFKNGFFDRG